AAGHAAAARLDRFDLQIGDELEHGFDCAEGIERLLMAVAVDQGAAGDFLQRKIEPASRRLPPQKFLEGQRLVGKPLRALVLDHGGYFVAETEQAARLKTDHREAARDK